MYPDPFFTGNLGVISRQIFWGFGVSKRACEIWHQSREVNIQNILILKTEKRESISFAYSLLILLLSLFPICHQKVSFLTFCFLFAQSQNDAPIFTIYYIS